MIYTHNLDPIIISFGGPAIHWYGLMYLLGLGFLYLYMRKFTHFSKAAIYDLLFYGLLGIIIGGRLGYFLFYSFSTFWTDFFEIFRIWNGGMSFHGGLVGVLVVVWYWCRAHRYEYLRMLDILTIPVFVGLMLGRIGNFINGELWGRVTDGSWGVIFPRADTLPRHPSQLYEALKNLLFAVGLYHFQTWKLLKQRGAMFFSGLTLYGFGRFLIEGYWREPLDGYIGVFTTGQFWTLIVWIIGMVGLWQIARASKLIK